MKLDPLTRTVSFSRADLAADLAAASGGKITSLDDVASVVHLVLDRALALTSFSDETIESLHDHLDMVHGFIERGSEGASLSLRIGAATYTAELS